MREIRQSGSEGGVADNGHPYPYLGSAWVRLGPTTRPHHATAGSGRSEPWRRSPAHYAQGVNALSSLKPPSRAQVRSRGVGFWFPGGRPRTFWVGTHL